MKRRQFITLLGGAAAAWPLAARAQQFPTRIPVVGVLWHAGSAEGEGSNFPALVKGFTDLGYVEGRTIVLDHRFPNEVPAQFERMAAELVASGVDVLIAVGANAAPYAKAATTRRENLKHSTDELRVQLEDAMAALGEAFEELKKVEMLDERNQAREKAEENSREQAELDRIAALRFNAGGAPA